MADGELSIFESDTWQMSFGERAALEGLLAQLEPRLTIEIGTAQGGSLARIAAHSETVHAIDLVEPPAAVRALPNVEFHLGDSHLLLPRLLLRLERESRSVDFALVDGDHSAEGVRRDLLDLLESPAVANAVLLIHDTMNPEVRRGVEDVPFERYAKVAYVDLEFVPGYFVREPPFANELWGGLGLVVVETPQRRSCGESIRQRRFYQLFDLIDPMAREIAQYPGVASLDSSALRSYCEEWIRSSGSGDRSAS